MNHLWTQGLQKGKKRVENQMIRQLFWLQMVRATRQKKHQRMKLMILTCLFKFIDRITGGNFDGNCVRETVIRINGIQVSHRFSSRIEEIECETDNHSPLVDPGVQAAEHQTHAQDGPKQTQAVVDRERQVEPDHPEWLQPFTEGFTVDRQVRQTYLQLRWRYHRQHCFLLRVLQRKFLRTMQEKSTMFSVIFRKTRISK